MSPRIMKRVVSALPWVLVALHSVAFGRGVSPYLPLNLEPEIERDIERVLILADKPVLTRPTPASLVLDALPKACAVDTPMCKRVRRLSCVYEDYAIMLDRSFAIKHQSALVKKCCKQGSSNLIMRLQIGRVKVLCGCELSPAPPGWPCARSGPAAWRP